MQNFITIYCKNTKQYHDIPCGTSLKDLYKMLALEMPHPVIAARVNYKVQSLNFLIYKPKDIEFIDATSDSGRRCYIRTLSMLMACAVRELWPSCDLRIEHPISKGFYCTIRESREIAKTITYDVVKQLKERMQQIVSEDRPIITEERQTKEVIRLFGDRHDGETTLFETLGNPYCRYYRMGRFGTQRYKPFSNSFHSRCCRSIYYLCRPYGSYSISNGCSQRSCSIRAQAGSGNGLRWNSRSQQLDT